MKISVLMSVYENDDPNYFRNGVESIINQTMLPNEIVLVIDGYINNKLEIIIDDFVINYPKLFTIIKLEKNVGLSLAMAKGLPKCKNEIVARMDADDISIPQRFEIQSTYLNDNPDVSCVGSSYAQYDNELKKYIGSRKLPFGGIELISFSKLRTPINHATIMFKKSVVLSIGGYPPIKHPFEDWWLANALIKNDYKVVNLEMDLVKVRGGKSFIQRRHGIKYAIIEMKNLGSMYQNGLIDFFSLIKNIFIRFPVRILPLKLSNKIYSLLRIKN
jgi:glycosyltransferase involved in cell wall biosynthesis